MSQVRPPLPAEEVCKAIEHRNPERVPMMIHQWNYAGAFGDDAPAVEAIMDEYPSDMFTIYADFPAFWAGQHEFDAQFSWLPWEEPEKVETEQGVGIDSHAPISDIEQFKEVFEHFPDASMPGLIRDDMNQALTDGGGRYSAMHWAFCFYERMWSMRGMENILCDFYEHPKVMHELLDRLCDFYVTLIQRTAREHEGVNAIYTTDDIGMQTGPMFSPPIFKEFFKPRYKRMIDAAHEGNMHFWLHTCGDVTLFMEDFIEIGLDVIHPIQKYTMSEPKVAEDFGGRIAFWAGMDVQQILPWGTPKDVRKEVRFMIDTYDRPDGGCMITAGNGITPDNPVENLRAFYDETYHYGLAHRAGFRS